MRLLDLVADAGPGVEASLVALAPALAARGMRITALCAAAGPLAAPLRALGVRVHVVALRDAPSWSAIAAAATLAEDAGADLIRAFPGSHPLGAIVGALVGRPCVAVPEAARLNMRELEAFRLADTQHLAVSGDAAALQARAAGLPADRVHVVPTAIDVRAAVPQRQALRQRLGIAPDALLVGYVGRLVHDAGPWRVIRAVLPAMQRHPALALVLAGEGSLQAALAAQAKRVGVASRVHFLQAPADALATATSADVLVLPGRVLADEHAALCAMHANVPVVADAEGPLAGSLLAGPGVVLVDTQRTDVLADAIATRVDADPVLREGPGAREHVARTHAAEAVADRLAALYARLAAPPRLAAAAVGERVAVRASR